jgi:tRNA A37 threonylcarbamoyladenosine biosynthesis protein TsaE
MSDCFKRWRDINSIEKLRERMSNQQKESLLKVLNGLLTTGKTAQVREAINKFRLNRRITEIQRNFLKRLLMSKAGLVVIAFRKVQTLPERKDNSAFLKASKFEKGLATFAERTLKRALGAFRNEYEEGQAAKKRAVIQLIDTTMGGQKKMYNRWKSITEKTRLMNECRQITSLFQTLNFAIKSVADLAFVDNKDSALKEKALIQLFKNLAGNMSDCFKRWRDINSIEKLRERMSNQQKESLLKVLNGLLTTGKTAQVREAINKFRLNRRITEIQRNFLKRLLMSKAGLVVIAFRKVQTLPERKDNSAFLKASKFEKGLATFAERTLKRALGAFRNEYEEGQAAKKRAVIQLIDTTMGGQKKMYNRWKSITEKTRLMNECRQITSLFQTLNFAIKSVADLAFVDNKDSALKEKALIQLFKNLAGNMSDCFKRWRDINSIEKLRERMSNQQKESLLKVLNGLLTTGKTAQVREAINKFRLNRRITEIQRNFLKRLLMSKAGLVVIAFRKVQTLPERKDNSAFLKASKFEKGLATFAERTLKRALGAFRNEYEEGQAAKKRAVIQLIDTTMGGQKKMYNRWKSITEKTRLMNECRQITSLFQTLNFAIKSVADLAFVDNKDSALKEKL